LDLKAGSGWHQAENSRGSAEYEQVRSSVTRSGHNAPHQVGTLRPVSSGANAKVAASVASQADYGCWAQEGLPTLSIPNNSNKGGRHDGYYNNTSHADA